MEQGAELTGAEGWALGLSDAARTCAKYHVQDHRAMPQEESLSLFFLSLSVEEGLGLCVS